MILPSLVTPSTRNAISLPNCASMSRSVAPRVLDDVVQQPGADAGGVELQLGDDARDADGMDEVRVAALALLALVHPRRVDVGLVDQVRVGRRWYAVTLSRMSVRRTMQLDTIRDGDGTLDVSAPHKLSGVKCARSHRAVLESLQTRARWDHTEPPVTS